MLQKIRDRIQGWFAGVIIAIIAGAFMLFGVEYYVDRGANNSKTVATVDGTKITEQQLNQTYNQIKRQQESTRRGAPLSEQFKKELKQAALTEIVNMTALVNAAAGYGFRVSPGQVQQLVMQAPELQVNGRFSPQRFQRLLYANQTTEQQFLDHIRGTLLTNQVALGIQSSEFVLPEELATAYRLIYQKRDFGYFILLKSKFESAVKVSEQEIKAYYKKNSTQFQTPEKVKISYLMLSPKSLEKNIQISQAQMRSYYDSNKASYSLPARWKFSRITISLPKAANKQQVANAQIRMKKLQAQLKKGVSFATLMKQSPQGQTATTTLIREDQASATLANLLSTMQTKQISTPFHTSDGINIVQLISKEAAKTKSFDEVQAHIKKALMRQQAEQVLSKQSDRLSNLTYTNPSTLQDAAKAMGIPVQTGPLVTRQGVKTGLFSNSAVLAAAFSDSVLTDGNNSNPITLKDGSVVVIRVSKHVPSSTQPLASVSGQIKKQFLRNKAEAKAGLEAYQIESALGNGKSPQALANKYGLSWTEKRQVSRKDKTVSAPILAAAFSTVPAKNKKLSGVNSLLLADGDYVVIKVFNINNANYSKATKKIRVQLTNELSNLWGQLDYKFYAKNIINRAKIKIENEKKKSS